MIVLIDVGNTNIVVGFDIKKKIYRFKTDKDKSETEYALLFDPILADASITAVVVSSVVPELNHTLENYFAEKYNLQPIFVGPGLKTGLKLKADNAREVGADLITAAVGVMTKYEYSKFIVIDLGTATTFSYIASNTLIGAIIAPGLKTSGKALINNASLLPNVSINMPKTVLGNNSVTCIQSGLIYGHAAMVEGIVKRIEIEQNITNVPVVMTGGLARTVYEALINKENIVVDDTIILDGLLEIYQKNLKN